MTKMCDGIYTDNCNSFIHVKNNRGWYFSLEEKNSYLLARDVGNSKSIRWIIEEDFPKESVGEIKIMPLELFKW